MDDKIHFKIKHEGLTRRFALSREEENLFSALKSHVLSITTAEDVSLYWKDEDTLLVLDTEEDLVAAIEFAQTQNKLACISLVTEPVHKEEDKKEDKKEVKKVVTEAESKAAYAGFSFKCADCKDFLAPSNGGRFRCLVCEDVEFCAACFDKNLLRKDGGHPDHAFVFFRSGETQMPAFERTFYAKDARKCTPYFKMRTNEWQKQKEQDAYVEAESKKGHFFDEIYMYGEPFPLLRPDTPMKSTTISENSSRKSSPVRVAERPVQEPRRERERAPNHKQGGDWECHVTDRNEIRARSDVNDGRRRVADRDARDSRERPQFEFYSSRFGGTQAILEQGGWRADRVNGQNDREGFRNREGSNWRRDQERGGTGVGRNGEHPRYEGNCDDDRVKVLSGRTGFEQSACFDFVRQSEEPGRPRFGEDRDGEGDNGRGFGGPRDVASPARGNFGRGRFGEDRERSGTQSRGFDSNRGRGFTTPPRGRFGTDNNERAVTWTRGFRAYHERRGTASPKGNNGNGRFNDDRERKDSALSRGCEGRGVEDSFGGRDLRSGGFSSNRDRDGTTSQRGHFGSGRFGEDRDRGIGTERNENRFGVPPRRNNFSRGFDSNRENRERDGGFSFGGNWNGNSRCFNPHRAEEERKEDERKKADHEAYKKAAQIPAHMMTDIIEELMTMSVKEMRSKLTRYARNLYNNKCEAELNPAEPIFPGAVEDERLVGSIAVDLRKHVNSVHAAIQKLEYKYRDKPHNQEMWREVIQLLEERLRLLESAKVEGKEYTRIAEKLGPILLVPRSTPRGRNSGNWDTMYVGFMEVDRQAEYQHPLELVASAYPTVEGKYAPRP